MVGAQAGIHFEQPHHALHHQGRSGEQDQGQRDLGNDQKIAQRKQPAGGGGDRAIVFDRQIQVGPRSGERRGQTTKDPGKGRQNNGDQDGGGLGAQFFKTREGGGGQRAKEPHTGDRQGAAEHASREGQEQTLNQKLPHDAPAACAQSGAHGNFPLSAQPPRKD